MIDLLEAERLSIQSHLDGMKTKEERNKLGQFATPSILAGEILSYAKAILPTESVVNFLDPALGSGSFYSALMRVFGAERIDNATAFEIDPHYGNPAQKIWGRFGLNLNHADFTSYDPNPIFDLVICNPPYVRHQHLSSDYKLELQKRSLKASGFKLSGLAGLYAHFLLQAHSWMAPGGIAGWLIPSEFMDVKYGRELKKYLLEKVTLLHIHRYSPNDVQFSDALVSSSIVWIKNEIPSENHKPIFSFGGGLLNPALEKKISRKTLAEEDKWTRFPAFEARSEEYVSSKRLGDFFDVKRGLATGDNKFFVLNERQVSDLNIPMEVLKPILPSPRNVNIDEIFTDDDGFPINITRLFLLDPNMDEDEIDKKFPAVADYLNKGKSNGVHEGYLCRNRKRWYDQEQRVAAPIVCTYMGRANSETDRPFRFLRNRSSATVANSYLALYPKPELQQLLDKNPEVIDSIWKQLNRISPDILLGEGRVYGGGLHKLEPRELCKVPLVLD